MLAAEHATKIQFYLSLVESSWWPLLLVSMATSDRLTTAQVQTESSLRYVELEYIFLVIDVYFCVHSQARTSGTGEHSGHRGEEEQHIL